MFSYKEEDRISNILQVSFALSFSTCDDLIEISDIK